MIHDVGLQNLPVIFAVDRAGLVGSDGETHQGIFDLSYLSSIPNMTILSPKHKWELADMLRFAVTYDGPIALRYPRGRDFDQYQQYRAPVSLGKSEMIFEEKDIAIFSVGHMFEEAVKVHERLKTRGFCCTLVNARFIKPLDTECIRNLSKNHRLIAVIEENVVSGACSERVSEYAASANLPVKVLPCALPDQYVEHGNVDVLRKETGIDAAALTDRIIETYGDL